MEFSKAAKSSQAKPSIKCNLRKVGIAAVAFFGLCRGPLDPDFRTRRLAGPVCAPSGSGWTVWVDPRRLRLPALAPAPRSRCLPAVVGAEPKQPDRSRAGRETSGRITDSKALPLKTAEGNKKDRSGDSHERAAKLATEAGITGIAPMGMRQPAWGRIPLRAAFPMTKFRFLAPQRLLRTVAKILEPTARLQTCL